MSKKKTPPLYGEPVLFYLWLLFWERRIKIFFWISSSCERAREKRGKKKQKTKKSARSCSYLVDPWSCSPTRISYRLLVPRYSSSVVPNWFPRVPFGCVLPLNSFQTCSSSLFLSQLLILWNLSLSLCFSLSSSLSLCWCMRISVQLFWVKHTSPRDTFFLLSIESVLLHRKCAHFSLLLLQKEMKFWRKKSCLKSLCQE
jgi:hypothetical protein